MEKSPLLHKHGVDDIKWWGEFVDLSTMAFQVSLATVARIALTSIDAAFLGHLPISSGVDSVKALAASSLAQVWTSVPLMGVWAGASALITVCHYFHVAFCLFVCFLENILFVTKTYTKIMTL